MSKNDLENKDDRATFFVENQREIIALIEKDNFLAQLKNEKTHTSLLHCAASSNALILGKYLVEVINNLVLMKPDEVKKFLARRAEMRQNQMDMDLLDQNDNNNRAQSKAINGGATTDEEINSKLGSSPVQSKQSSPGKRGSSDAGSKSASGAAVVQAGGSGARGGTSPRPPQGGRKRKPKIQEVKFSDATFDHFDPNCFRDLVEYADISGLRPLHYASFEGHIPFIDLLCDHGADVMAKDELGQTCLHWAVQGGCHEACARLLQWERGALALCLSCHLGRTPVDIARIWDNTFEYLRNHRSLLVVLSTPYTKIEIPQLAFKERVTHKKDFLTSIGANIDSDLLELLAGLGESGNSAQLGSRGKTSFQRLAGDWKW